MNWLIKQLVTVAVLATAVASAQQSTIQVSDVEQLYTAVNNPANAGATVVLARGVYVLSPDRPNRGRLELQLDMSLVGVEGDQAQVTIDASALPSTSFAFKVGRPGGGRTGVIGTGRGNNTIEWLTIAGNPAAAGSISTDLVQTDATGTPLPTALRVAHVSARNSARGLDIRNATVDTKRRRIVAEIEYSDFYFGVEGIRVANFVQADDAEITADMRGNRSHGNRLGCIFENNRSSKASIAVRSDGDVFDDNGLGCMIGGGLVSSGSADSNTTRFDAHASLFINNTRTVFNDAAGGPQFTDTGGVVVIGAEVLSAAALSTSGNTDVVRLWDCQIAGNHLVGRDDDFEVEAFGARSEVPSSDELTVKDNHALIQLRGTTAAVDIVEVDRQPADLDGTNKVTVVRIP